MSVVHSNICYFQTLKHKFNSKQTKKEIVYITPQLFRVDYFTLQTIKPDFLSSQLFKTGQITPQAVLDGGFATVMVGLSLSLLFISAESLKNHSKSQKNHKMKNLILLDSTWVDLHNEHIIWYALVQSFWCSFRSILFYN